MRRTQVSFFVCVLVYFLGPVSRIETKALNWGRGSKKMAIGLGKGNRFGDNQISYTKLDPSMSHTFSGNIHLATNLEFA